MSFHHDVKWKIKITCKPHLIGNEVKHVRCLINCCSSLELYKDQEIIKKKPYVNELCANVAATLHLSEYYSSAQIVIGR